MKRALSFTRKLLITLLVGALVVPSGILIAPRPAYAIPAEIVSDTSITSLVDLAKNTITSIESHITAWATTQSEIKQYILDPLAWAVAKAAVQSITASTVRWINSGFQGAPAFVINPTQLYIQVGDVAALTFFNQANAYYTGNGSPFQNQISRALQQNYFKSTAPGGFFLLNPYTLKRFATNPAGFLSGQVGSFAQGGWSGWFALTTNPANNPIDSYYLQEAERNNRVAAAQAGVSSQLAQNRGFLSWCNTDAGTTVTAAGLNLGNVSGATDSQGNIRPVVVTPAANQVPAAARVQGCINSDGSPGTVQTPGSVIESQLEQVLGSGITQLNLANSFNEIVGALAQQLILQVLGPNGLLGLVSGSSSGGSSYANQLAGDTSGSSAVVASTMASLSTNVSQEIQQVQTYQDSWVKIEAAANAAKSALATAPSTCPFVEGSSAQNVSTNVIQPVIDQANAATDKANAALDALNTIQDEIVTATATSTSPSDQVTAAQHASSDYQTLQGSDTLPSADDITYAQMQGVDAGGNGATTTLLSQMNNIVKEVRACKVLPLP